MNTHVASFGSPWHPRLLAGLLRSSRLTLLFGDAGAVTTALLQTGVLPLLCRRNVDRALLLGCEPGPTPRAAEIAIVVDAWSDTPLAQVQQALRRALPQRVAATLTDAPGLADMLGKASRQLGARFLFIFDRLESCLVAPPRHEGMSRFAEELASVVYDPALPAHFLFALGEDAETGADRLAGQDGGLGEQLLRLPHARARLHPPQLALDELQTSAEPPAASPPITSPEQIYRLIDTTLAGHTAEPADEPWRPPAPAVAPRPHRPVWPWLAGVGAMVLAALALPWRLQGPSADPAPPVAPAPASAKAETPSPPSTSPPAPDYAAELAGLIGPAPHGWADALAFRPGAPRMVMAHYDTLLAARDERTIAPLRIVAPLALDPVLFVVRAEAPLNFVHQIAGRRLDAGPADGARAVSATTVYRRLFGTMPTISPDGSARVADALQRLADSPGSGAVLVLVGARTLDEWAAAHPDAMRRLKPLVLDREQAASRKALQTYLPLPLRAAEHPAWLAQDLPSLATMSFLVTSAAADETESALVVAFARTLCARLPQLQRSGDPAWREVALQRQLPAPWPYSPVAAQAFTTCAAASSSPQPSGDRP